MFPLSRVSLLLRRALAVAAVALVAPAVFAQSERHRPGDSVIIYADFAFLAPATQPVLVDLLRSSDAAFAEPGDKMRLAARQAATQAFSQAGLKRWTSHPLVASREELRGVLSRKLGRPAELADMNAFTDHFQNVYVLMFVGGLEVQAEQEAASAEIGRQYGFVPDVHRYTATSVSAILFDLKTSRSVVASATSLGFQPGTHKVGNTPAQAQMVAEVAQSYADASSRSASDLATILAKVPPERDARRAGWDRYVVTHGWIEQSAGTAASLVGWTPAARWQGAVCNRPTQCTDPDGDCAKTMAFMVHAMTSAASRAGLLTDPPLFSAWNGAVAENVTVSFSLSRLQDPPLELEALRIPQDVKGATFKLVPSLYEAQAYSRKEGVFETRTWGVDMRYAKVSTDTDSCETDRAATGFRPVDGKLIRGVSSPDSAPPSRPPASAGMQRMQLLLAIDNAISKMPSVLEKDARK